MIENDDLVKGSERLLSGGNAGKLVRSAGQSADCKLTCSATRELLIRQIGGPYNRTQAEKAGREGMLTRSA